MTFFTFTKDMADSGVDATTPGVFEFAGQIISFRDNATGMRVKGPQSPNEGVLDVQSYSGIFYNVAYAGTGTLETRVIHGANVEMDMELQSPHQLRLVAVDDSQADGKVYVASKTNMVFNMRADAEVASPAQLVIDRVNKGTTGAANTSDVEVSVSSGNLVLASVPVLPTYLTTGLPPVVAGGMIFVSDADTGNGRIAYGNTGAAAWIDPQTGVAVAV